jgi:Transglutaminase-like superfamily
MQASVRSSVLIAVLVFTAASPAARRAAAASSATPTLDAAVSQVSNEIAFVRTQVPSEQAEYIAALAALDFTVGHVNAPLYGWRNTVAGLDQPDCRISLYLCAENTLRLGAGICGNAAAVYVAILERLGISAHRLNLFYTAPNGTFGGHTTAEVYWAGSWHLMDPTWGVFFRTSKVAASAVLSWARVARLKNASRYMVQDRSQLWWQISSYEMHSGWNTGYSALLDSGAKAVVVPN